MIVADLITRLGFNYNPADLNRFINDINNAAKQTARQGALMATAFFGAFIGVSIKTFATFEQQMKQTQAVLIDTSETNIKKLEEQAKLLGETTKFTAKEAAAAQTEFARAGFKTDQIYAALPGTLALASAAQLSIADAAATTGELLNSYQLDASQAGYVSDLFARSASSAALTVSDLRETLKYVAPVAKSANQGLEEMITLINLAANAGIKGSNSGTALRMALVRLQKPPRMAADALKKLNISVGDENGNMRALADILQEITVKTQKYTQVEKNGTIAKIFGVEALSAMLSIMNTSKKKYDDMRKAVANNKNAALDMAKVINSGVVGTWDVLTSTLEGVVLKLGEALAPALIQVMKGFTELFQILNTLNPVVYKITAAILLMGVALSGTMAAILSYQLALPTLTLIKNMVLSIKLATMGMWAAWALGAVVLVLLINDIYTFLNGGDSMLGRLSEGTVFLRDMLNWLKRSFNENYEAIREMGFLGIEVFKQFLNGAVMMAYYLSKVIQPILTVVVGIFSVFWALLASFFALIQGLGTEFGKVFNGISNFVQNVINLVEKLKLSLSDIVKIFSGQGLTLGLNAIANLLPTFPSLSAATAGNNINSTVQVSVGGSNATPSQIANAVVAGNNKSLRGQLATSARNQPKVVR